MPGPAQDPLTPNEATPGRTSPERLATEESVRLSPGLVVLGLVALAIGIGAGLVMSSLAQR